MTVAHTGSISAAGDQLLVSQPAVTRAVSVLEADLRLRLFERSNSLVRPTPDGVLLVRAGERIFEQLARIENDDAGFAERPICLASPFLRQVSDHELTALIAVACGGSQRRAAEQLGLTQASISRSLGALESRLGRKVMDPAHPGRVAAWANAAAMRAKRALADLVAIEAELAERLARRNARTVLRVGALPASRAWLIPQAVGRFALSCGAASIAVVDGNYETLLARLLAGEIDVMIGSIRPDDLPKWIDAVHLTHDRLVIAARADHRLSRARSVAWGDLASANWVLPPHATPLRREFDDLCVRYALAQPHRIVEADSLVVARALLMSGDWIGVFSASQVLPEERHGALARVPVRCDTRPRSVGYLLRRGEPVSPDLGRFLKCLNAAAKEIGSAGATSSEDVLQEFMGRAVN